MSPSPWTTTATASRSADTQRGHAADQRLHGRALDDPRAGRRGLAVLAGQPECDAGRLAAIGYCFGGTTVLELARSGADLKAVVGFHSGLGTTRPRDAERREGQGPDLHRRRTRSSRPTSAWPSRRR